MPGSGTAERDNAVGAEMIAAGLNFEDTAMGGAILVPYLRGVGILIFENFLLGNVFEDVDGFGVFEFRRDDATSDQNVGLGVF